MQYFMFNWSIYRLFVLKRGWKRESIRNIVIRICFLVMKHRWTENAFWDVNNKKCRKWCKILTPILFNHSYGLPVITMDTKCPNQVYNVWLVDLQTICAKYGLKTWFSPIDDIRKCLLDIKHGSNENAFRDVINKKWCKFVSPVLFNNTYALPALTKDTKFQIKYFIFDWLIYRIFVLNRSWKSDSLQIMTFVYICSTWSIVEIKTRFETWIKRNVVNGVRLIPF
jgi:hypothetical protein